MALPRDAALLTDLYQLTMAAAYVREAMDQRATFSLFVRRLPDRKSTRLNSSHIQKSRMPSSA